MSKRDDDRQLVIAEAAINALSYAAVDHGPGTSAEASGGESPTSGGMRLISTAGAMNPDQPALLRQAMVNMPSGSRIIAAVDHDAGGDALAEHAERVFEAIRRDDIGFERRSPVSAGNDWNDVLRGTVATAKPARHCE